MPASLRALSFFKNGKSVPQVCRKCAAILIGLENWLCLRLRIGERSFAYTRTIVWAYANDSLVPLFSRSLGNLVGDDGQRMARLAVGVMPLNFLKLR